MKRTTVDIAAQVGPRRLDLRATGQVVKFDGFLTLYQEGKDDDADEDEGRLPPMKAAIRSSGAASPRPSISPNRRRASRRRASSSAWKSSASAAPRLTRRSFRRCATGTTCRIEKKRLVPEDKGRIVIAFLEAFFRRYVEFDFTADLEEKLDRVSNNEIDWKQVLREFWRDFSAAIGETKELRTAEILEALNELLGPHIFPDKGTARNPRACPSCGAGQLSLKLGKFGAFIGCSNYPECKFTRQIAATGANGDGEGASRGRFAAGRQGVGRRSGDRLAGDACAMGASVPSSSSAKAKSPSARPCRRA